MGLDGAEEALWRWMEEKWAGCRVDLGSEKFHIYTGEIAAGRKKQRWEGQRGRE